MGVHGRAARDRAVDDLRRYLENASSTDFAGAEDFAEKLTQRVVNAYEAQFASAAARAAIRRTTEAIYRFYRLRDLTPFDGDSPVKLRFGGPDKRTIKFIDELDHWYFSKFVDNRNTGLREFFRKKYLENGAALFGRESREGIDEFRKAAGGKLDNINDVQVRTIAQQSVQRARNWGNVWSLDQAEVERCRYVALLDNRTTELCREIDGKEFRVGPARDAIERLIQLEPGAFAAEMYESAAGRAFSKDPVGFITPFIEEDGKTISDQLVATGRAVPPLHLNCRTRLIAVIEG